jgi:D-alanyl-D-alanine carboxypeptidase
MKRRRKRRAGFPWGSLPIIILIVGIFIGQRYILGGRNAEALNNGEQSRRSAEGSLAVEQIYSPETKNGLAGVLNFLSGEQNGDRQSESAPTVQISIDEITDTGYLKLINGEYEVKVGPDEGAIVSVWPTVAVSTTDITMHETALAAVNKLFSALSDQGVDTLYVSSGYRDHASQKKIYDDIDDKSYAQPPNHSEHQTGLAADILAIGLSQQEMAESRTGRLLMENSWKYGLILRYPEGKQEITKIAAEPWHFRYVGQPHAWFCKQNDLCLEEYIQYMKDKGGYSTEVGGKKYTVLYEIPVNDMINAPKSLNYRVSSDNTGGYIVTAWE